VPKVGWSATSLRWLGPGMFVGNPAPVFFSEHRMRVFALGRAAIPASLPFRFAEESESNRALSERRRPAVAGHFPTAGSRDCHRDFALWPIGADRRAGPDKYSSAAPCPAATICRQDGVRQGAAPIADDRRHRHPHDVVAPTFQ